MLKYTPVFVFISVCLCSISVDCHRRNYDCSDRPVIPGAVATKHGRLVRYQCLAPNTYYKGGHRWNCATRQWVRTCIPLACTMDGGLSPWGDWSNCPGRCGIHSHTRVRTCTNPAPANGGASCEDADVEETEPCFLAKCPGSCTARWTNVYAHDENGQRVSGDKAELLDLVQRGAEIRVGKGDYFTTIQNAIPIANGDLCAQALHHISKNGYDSFQDNAYWWFVNLCTTGSWYMTRYYVGVHDHRSTNEITKAMTWFVRSKCLGDPALEISSNGTVLYGSVAEVIKGVASGAGIHIRKNDNRYTFPADNVRIDQGQSLVSAQALWHVSQHMPSGYKIFQDNAYWFFTVTSTDGDQEITRWNVGEHQNRNDTSRSIGTSWFLDTCWKEVYRHDSIGTGLSGSLTALTNAVLAGHKIKLVYDDYSIEADHLWVRHGKVYAMLVSSLTQNGIKYFDSDVNWYWQIASTDGGIETIKYLVGEHTAVGGTTLAQQGMAWYADDRAWSLAVSVNQAGTVVSGSKEVLEHATRNGADVRTALRFDEIPNYTTVFSVDNLAINGSGDIGAMHLRSISTSFTGTTLNFQENPYWWLTIVATTGRLDMSRWRVGAHDSVEHSNRQVNVDFFICE